MVKEFTIGRVAFSPARTVVIAEAGVNHIGRMDYAEELVKTAARAGADMVKFQTYKARKLVTRTAPRYWDWDGERQQEGSQYDSFAILDSFEKDDYAALKALCDKYAVEFLSTPFDEDSVDLLVDIGIKGFKMSSSDITNLPLLAHVGAKGLPVLLSTGAADIDEIRTAVTTMEEAGSGPVCVMHCTLCYPTDPKDSNLRALNHLAEEFPDFLLGLSDHTLGTIVPAASVLYGSRVVEKHYTFDKTLPDSADHWLSLNEAELKRMVDDIRELEQALGSGRKEKLECEMDAHHNARRSVVAARPIKAGQVIVRDDVTCKRPGHGLAPQYLERFVGRTAARDLAEDAFLQLDDVTD